MSTYRHTQLGTGLLTALGVAVALIGVLSFGVEWNPIAGAVLILLALVAVLFHSLTVEIGDGILTCRFGPGLIRKRFRLSEIRSARAMRNPWYAGWGIHWTLSGWQFSVSGWKAVEIKLINGRRYRIGTDEPEALLAALRRDARLII